MIGILKKELGWLQICEQEGILYEHLDSIPPAYNFPIVINREPSDQEVSQLKNLLNNGIGIITGYPTLNKIIGNIKVKKVKYLLNNGSDIFNNIIGIDFEHLVYGTEIYQTDYGNGYIITLPFDVNQAILDTRSELKPFYYPSRKFPNEIASKVSKGEVRKLVINCIKKLYQKMNLNYCHVWYYPSQLLSAFAFRVDTDFGPENTVESTFNLEDKTEIKFTYFVNTKEHPTLANHQHDFQIHCYKHKVYKDYQTNYNNIKKAKEIIEKTGVKPIGFVSPFGLWNANLQKAIEDNRLEYSSEFSLAYDDLPFFPVIENRKSSVLQIPVHPVCIGRLVHASLTPDQCIDYYKRYFLKQYQTHQPIFIYDHPHRIAQFFYIFNKIIAQAKVIPNIWFTSLTEFYHWWKTRSDALANTKWQINHHQLQIETPNQNNQLFMHIITPSQTETFVPLKQGIYNLQDFSYKSIIKPVMDKNEIANYLKLKSKKTRLQIKLYKTIDTILHIFK